MRKKLLLVVAIMALVAISVTALVGCGAKTVEEFIEKIGEAKTVTVSGTMEGAEFAMQYDGENVYTKTKMGIIIAEIYVMKEGDKSTMYIKTSEEWGKMSAPAEMIPPTGDAKEVLLNHMEIDFAKESYDIKDGVWTLKTDSKQTMTVKKGNLVLTNDKDTLTVALSKVSIKLPSAAKNAKDTVFPGL